MLQKVFLYAAFIFLFLSISDGGAGRTGDALREQLNRGTVKLVASDLEYVSTIYMRMAGEIATLLDKKSARQTIHILPRLTRAERQAPGTLAVPTRRWPA